jgi:hypothetical protein
VLPFEGSPIGELRDTGYAGLRSAQFNRRAQLNTQDAGRQTARDFVPARRLTPKSCPTRAGRLKGGHAE